MRKSPAFLVFVVLFLAFFNETWGWEDVQVTPACIYTPEGYKTDIDTLSRISVTEGWRWIAVYSPHPDDEIFGLGAAMSSYKRTGFKVLVVLLTHGEKSFARETLCSLGFCFSEEEFGLFRTNEFRAAMTTLGVYHVIYNLGDGNLKEKTVKELITYYDSLFDVSYHFATAPEKGMNQDHVVTSKALRDAPVKGGKAVFGVYIFVYCELEIHESVILTAEEGDLFAKRDALYQYRYWYPEKGRYGIAYLSSPQLWDVLYSRCDFEVIRIIFEEE
jgi:LmbE family N-acetylglucosaminyl deacetylase